MKKIYTQQKYKERQKRIIFKRKKKSKKKRKLSKQEINKKKALRNSNGIKDYIVAPPDLRLMDNLENSLKFFRDLRGADFVSKTGNLKYIGMSLKNVKHIDYGTISILTALNDDLKFRKIILRTILPDDENCRNFIIESGYLNNLYDGKGNRIQKVESSELISFEKGKEYLSHEDSKKISLILKKVVDHLTGTKKYCQPIKSIILEICGNSIEWSNTKNKQWLLGVKYESNKVIFTVTDVGLGILNTLERKFGKQVVDFIRLRSKDQILERAFDKKYGSKTNEVNRNKGLPAIKTSFIEGKIKNLKVLTNNVILHFDDESKSKTLKKGAARFKGTFYQWEMTRECLTNI